MQDGMMVARAATGKKVAPIPIFPVRVVKSNFLSYMSTERIYRSQHQSQFAFRSRLAASLEIYERCFSFDFVLFSFLSYLQLLAAIPFADLSGFFFIFASS